MLEIDSFKKNCVYSTLSCYFLFILLIFFILFDKVTVFLIRRQFNFGNLQKSKCSIESGMTFAYF